MPMPAMLRTAATILCALVSTGCASTATVRPVPLPAELTACADEPAVPELPQVDWSSLPAARPLQLARDRLTLDFVLALRRAGADCRARVAGAKAWNDALHRAP